MNHLDLVGWINTARYKWAEIRGREIKFKPATFYLGCADLLARKVERLGDDDSGEGSGSGQGSEDSDGDGEAKELGRKVADEGSEAGEAGKNKERAKAKVNGGKLKVNGSHHLRRDEHDASSSSVQELGRKVAGESSKAAEAEAEADETRSRARPRAATETEEDITGRGMIFDAGELDSPDWPVDRRRSVHGQEESS